MSARLAALASYDILDTPPDQTFDDVTLLASRVCETPVALVSLIDRDRQWFKSRLTFPTRETDLESSVCKFALDEPDVLVIPSLTQDPRTRDNPFVVGEPFIRFYAGAPLRTPDCSWHQTWVFRARIRRHGRSVSGATLAAHASRVLQFCSLQ